jgi:CRP-like cAMP-binding protein
MKLAMCKHMKRIRYPPDTVLVAEGEQSDSGFWIREGKVRYTLVITPSLPPSIPHSFTHTLNHPHTQSLTHTHTLPSLSQVRVSINGQTRAFLEDGQYFGESSFLAKFNKRNATVVTVHETEAYTLNREKFWEIAADYQGIADGWSNKGLEMQTYRI